MAALAQQTGANIASQNALMAGQRGAGANAGLIARQAAQQGANTQQQAVGQGATMQAQQALNAIGQAGGIANTQAANQIGATQGLTAAQQAQQGQLLGANQGFQSNQVAGQSSVNAGNTSLANTQMTGQQNLIGGALNTIAGGSKMAFAAGGEAEMASPTPQPYSNPNGPQSMFGRALSLTNAAPNVQTSMQGAGRIRHPQSGDSTAAKPSPPSGITNVDNMGNMIGDGTAMAKGGMVKAIVSPGEKILNPMQAKAAKEGSGPALTGKTVPGKAKVGGAKNDYANDVVPAKLAEGSIVLPRSVTQAKDKIKAAEKFIAALKKKSGK